MNGRLTDPPVELLQRDIVSSFHEYVDYAGVMGEMDWGLVYSLPYWEYLDLEGMYEDERVFIRDGCLLLILAMAFNAFDHHGGSKGNRISRHAEDCIDAVNHVRSDDADTQALTDAVLYAINRVKSGQGWDKYMMHAAVWAFRRYVATYFENNHRTCAAYQVPGADERPNRMAWEDKDGLA